MNILAASGASKSKIEDAQTFARKIYGTRKSKAAVDNPATATIDESDASHSASQQSYTQTVEHLDNYIGSVSLEPLYNPNETDVKTAALQTLSTDLRARNDAVIAADTAYDNKLDARDHVYYGDTTGLVNVAKSVKQYVKGAFGADSPEYNQIKDLEFRRVPR